jgi:glycine cleavage system H protein
MLSSDLHFPEDLRYDLRHTWVRTEGDDAVIGVTDYAQCAWGDAGFVQLPPPGTEVISGQAIGQVSCALAGPCDLFTPLSGTVIAVNDVLTEDPSLVNTEPYAAGWLLRLEPSEPAQLRDLLDAGAYRRALAETPLVDLLPALSGIFRYSVDPMLLIDRNRRIVAMNPAAEELTGCAAKSVVGTTQCFHLLHCVAGGEELHGVTCLGVMAREEGLQTGCFRIQRQDGDIIPVSASYSPLPPVNGSGPLTLITMRPLD